jgi:hypothetical protein
MRASLSLSTNKLRLIIGAIEVYHLKAATLPGEGKKILVVAVFTLHPGKAVFQVAAIKITVNDFPEESVGPLKPFLVALDEGFQMILDTTVIIGSLWIAGPIHDGWIGHDSSPPRKKGRLY